MTSMMSSSSSSSNRMTSVSSLTNTQSQELKEKTNSSKHTKEVSGEFDLGAAFLPVLDNIAVEDYRRQYQSFRTGESKGAKGERPDLRAAQGRKKTNSRDETGGEFVDKDMEMFDQINQFRISYSRYRMGYARGAKGDVGEIARKMTMRMSRKLPVAQLAHSLYINLQYQKQLKAQLELFQNDQNSLLSSLDLPFKEQRKEVNRDQEIHRHKINAVSTVSSSSIEQLEEKETRVRRGGSVQMKEEDLAKLLPSTGAFHIHIGAGKLGLGLIVPALLRSLTQFAILQRPSRSWDVIIKSMNEDRIVHVVINGETLEPGLLVVQSLDDLPQEEEYLSHRIPLLVLSDEEAVLDWLVSQGTSYSISLGPAMCETCIPLFEQRLDFLHANNKPEPLLYAAENDHKMVDKLEEALHGKVRVLGCMVDRICVGREIEKDKILLEAEPYEGEVVVMGQPSDRPPPPMAGEHIRAPPDDALANYYCRRKLLLVNGTHTTLAFLTLTRQEPPESTVPGEYWLIDWDVKNVGEKTYKEIWAWAVARLLILLWENDVNTICDAHNTDDEDVVPDLLLTHTRKILKRFSSVKDTTTRILKGGIANRWETRLNNVCDFLDTYRPDSVANKLLKKAGLTLTYIRTVTRELSESSKRFTGVNVQKPKVVIT